MEGDDPNDPYYWDDDRLIQELCHSNRQWKARSPPRPLDLQALKVKLRDCGVDGASFLTYSEEFGIHELFKVLGIKKLPHQQFLRHVINELRASSEGYRNYKRQWDEEDEMDSVPIKRETRQQSSLEPPRRGSPDAKPRVDLDRALQAAIDSQLRASAPGVLGQGVLSPALSSAVDLEDVNHGVPENSSVAGSEPMDIDSIQDNNSPPSANQPPATPEGPPLKKRRIAPTLISSEPIHTQPAPAPTEGDAFAGRTTIFRYQAPPGWLGPGALTMEEILNPTLPDDMDENHVFSLEYQDHPPGRRRQVWGAMKRHSLSVRPHKTFEVPREQKEESPLPVFGESDDEGGMDSETWEEIQEEEEEDRLRALREKEAATTLSKDKVQATIAQSIGELEAQWVAEHQPRHDRRARNIWESARRNPNREAYIKSIRKLKDEAVRRIPKFEKQILMERWKSDEKLHELALNYLEQSVFEKCYQTWLLGVLESPRCPPKPTALPRPTPRPRKERNLAEDEEDLASSESEMGDFLDDQDDEVMISNSLVEVEPSPDHELQLDDTDILAHTTPKKIKAERAPVPSTPNRPMAPTPEIIMIEDSPLVLPPGGLPEFTDRVSLEKMGELGVDYWVKAQDPERLLAAILCTWTKERRERLLKVIGPFGHKEIWEKHMQPVIESDGHVAKIGTDELALSRLFDAFLDCSTARLNRSTLRPITLRQIQTGADKFETFYRHLKKVLVLFRTDKPLFGSGSRRSLAPATPTKSLPLTTPTESIPSPTPAHAGPPQDTPSPEAVFKQPAQDPSQEAVSQDPAAATLTLADEDEAEFSDEEAPLSKKKRKRKQKVNQDAELLRVETVQQVAEFDRRRRRLQEEIASQGLVPSNMARLIVNETKKEGQPLIFINGYIGSKIKDHQIDGLRFMWNQVVVSHQGCLLSHTMGLGKTMQVITLLVVIAEASASEDPAVRKQIPKKLRKSKTLVLCPSGLVDNWIDELNMWAPEGLLGPLYQVGSSVPSDHRVIIIQKWASDGGVLVIGYEMFSRMAEDEEMAKVLQESPNLVVGDEAHAMKNPKTKRSQATANFRTKSRIAMTGSPLTNNVMDYYAMINWVSPGYLSDIEEFNSRFGNPIKEGLYADSNLAAKRQARKLLHILKETVNPKVHRRDVQVLRHELPTKKEFIVVMPLTQLQQELYDTYIDCIHDERVGALLQKSSAQVWSLVAKLGLVLAHPKVFRTVAESRKNGKPSGEEDDVDLPEDILCQLLTPASVRDIDDNAHSNKIIALLFLLERFRELGDKALIFTQSIPTMDFVESIFKRKKIRYQRLDGKTPISTRQASIKKFNNDEAADVYLISTKAGGVGLNIYGANRVVIFDFKYTPTDEQQAIGRAYRLGQNKPVYVYWLMVGGTFETTIHKSAVFKTQLASRLVDKKNPIPYATRMKEYFVKPQSVDQEDLSEAYRQDKVLDALLDSEEVGCLVREVTSTETFEKEETYELPPEDQEEAKKEVELAFLRLRDPQAYAVEIEKFRQERQRFALGIPLQGLVQPNTMAIANQDFRTAQANLFNNSILPQSRENSDLAPFTSSTPLPLPPNHHDPQAAHPNTAVSIPPDVPPAGVPAPAYRLEDSELRPVLAPGSFVTDAVDEQALPSIAAPLTTPQVNENPEVSPSDAQPVDTSAPDTTPPKQAGSPVSQLALQQASSSRPAPLTQQTPVSQRPRGSSFIRPPTSSASLANSARPDFPELRQLYEKLCGEGKEVVYTPEAVTQGVEEALREKGFGYEHLSAKDKWQNLQKCSRNPRFAEAMLSGYIRPDQLVARQRKDLHTMVARFNDLGEEDFKSEVWGSRAENSNKAEQRQSTTKVKDEFRVSKVKSKAKASGSTPKRPLEARKPRTPNIGPGPGGRQRPAQPGDSAESPYCID